MGPLPSPKNVSIETPALNWSLSAKSTVPSLTTATMPSNSSMYPSSRRLSESGPSTNSRTSSESSEPSRATNPSPTIRANASRRSWFSSIWLHMGVDEQRRAGDQPEQGASDRAEQRPSATAKLPEDAGCTVRE